MIVVWIVLIFVVVLVLAFIGIYNSLIVLRNRVRTRRRRLMRVDILPAIHTPFAGRIQERMRAECTPRV